MIWIYVAGIIIAYLIGTISPSLIISSIKKKDIRSYGSKNLGASNTAILLGWKLGVLVGALDIFKGVLVVALARFVIPMAFPEVDTFYLPFCVASAVILGHIFPFYLKFKGGKGFATLVGVSLMLDWRFFIGLLIVIILAVFVFDYIAIATLIASVSLPIYSGIINQNLWAGLILAVGTGVIFSKHIVNIKKMIKKEEIGFKAMISKKHNI